jgi:predicted extracellular nuclease
VLKKYAEQKEQGASSEDDSLVEYLAKKLNKTITEDKKTVISTRLRSSLHEYTHWRKAKGCLVTGEWEEKVDGVLSQQPASGQPDFVLRIENPASIDQIVAAQKN